MKATKQKEGRLERALKLIFIFSILGSGLASILGALLFTHYSSALPKLITVADYKPLTVSRVYDSAGVLMGEFYLERRYLIPYEKMPDLLVRAFISAEDDQFFQHQGVNFASILRASIANFKAGHVVQGGSTITQQVAKSLLLTSERSFSRKIKELILAYRMESNLTKQQILYLYLNQIYLGHGAHGVQAAARIFYRKDVSELTLPEAAMLGGMPQAPGKFSPHLNPKKAKERQIYVLRRMYENHFITQEEFKEASAQPIKIFHDEEVKLKYSPFLIEHVRKYLVEKYGESQVNEEGLIVTLPTQADLVLKAKNQLQAGLRTVDQRSGYRGPIEHLKTDAEIEKKLKDLRMKLLNRRLGFQILTSDGRMDYGQAISIAGLKSEAELLALGELYQAVVTQVDDAKKVAIAMIGAVRVAIPIDKMRWAHWNKEGKSKADPKVPSQVVAHGDVVWVKPEKIDGSNVIASFEQIPIVQGALFSLEAQTGNVLAMEGGYSFELSEFNRAYQAKRQPGSAFKPIIYAAGVERGFTPATIIVDSPIVYDDAENGKWKPANFEEKFYGDTTFRQALIKSRNVPTIKIMQAVQIPYALDFARRIGMTGADLKPDLSTSLGSGGVSLFELTKTFALFPRLGRMVEPIFISQVKDRDGKILEESKPKPSALSQKAMDAIISGSSSTQTGEEADETPTKPVIPGAAIVKLPKYPLSDDPLQVMDPRVAYVMTHLMKEVVTYGTGHEAKNLDRPAAGKTGTTSDSVDAWFMGFTPFVVTGAWVGTDGQKPIGHNETGARAALPIWLGFMKEAVKNYPEDDFVVPPKIVFATIDQHTGKLVQPNASTAIREAFIEGTEPKSMSSTSSNSTESSSDFFKEDSE